MTVALTEDEEGKNVVDADGTEVGVVADVHHGTAHVEADPAVVERMQARLEAGGIEETTYALSEEDVGRIEDDRIVLETTG